MNLIEQLGGYEVVKELRHYLFCYVDGEHYAEVDKALLEYRRQYNIFEVGDLVVEIAESPETSILGVIYMSEHLMVCENDSLNASYGILNKKPSFYVRHASDEEIKAGHRL